MSAPGLPLVDRPVDLSRRRRLGRGGVHQREFLASDIPPTTGITTVTATLTGTVIPDRLFVDIGVTQLP